MPLLRGQAKPAVFAEEIREGEGEVVLVLGEAAFDGSEDIGFGDGAAERGGEGAQKAEAALADDAVGFFGDDAEHAGDAAVVAAERAVGEGVVGLLAIAAALEEEEQGFVPGGGAGLENGFDAGTDVVPDFAPDFARRAAESPRMLLAEGHAGVGVVVEEGEVGAPAHPHGVAGGEQDADDGAEALRPGFDGAEGRGGPVEVCA